MPRPELAPDEIVGILRTSVASLRDITDGLSEAQIDWEANHDGWSIRYILGHLRSSE